MLINLLPDFLAVLDAGDREAAYRQYREAHRPILDAYWRNYVLDPDSPHAGEIVTAALRADRSDLLTLADSVDLVQLAEEAIARAEELLQVDRPDRHLPHGRARRRQRRASWSSAGAASRSSASSTSPGGSIPRPTAWACRPT